MRARNRRLRWTLSLSEYLPIYYPQLGLIQLYNGEQFSLIGSAANKAIAAIYRIAGRYPSSQVFSRRQRRLRGVYQCS